MMDDNVMIEVKGVSKKFSRSLKRSMVYGAWDIFRNSLNLSSKPEKLRKNEFWALNDISFSLKRGEALGIIGPNGSGKTTLLKMLNGIFWPDKGRITIRGRVGALIEVGAGFHPMLTGKENIYLNGSILGMKKDEIDRKFDEIVEFAGIGDFLNTPVKHYSSGMYVRLGFSIAIHSDPDILLIDEILAVGDMEFRRKCYNMIDRMKEKCGIILISHNMFQIGRVCDRVGLVHNGVLAHLGRVNEGIAGYYRTVFRDGSGKEENIEGEIRLKDFKFELKDNDRLEAVFNIRKSGSSRERKYILSVTFTDVSGQLFAHSNSLNNSRIFSGEGPVTMIIPNLNFNHGRYSVSLIIYDENHSRFHSVYRDLFTFEINTSFIGGANTVFHDAEWYE